MANSKSSNKIHLPSAWKDVKLSIQTRPILMYLLSVPIEEVNTFLLKAPQPEEVERLRAIIAKDREEKTIRLKEYLTKVVNYREITYTANRIGISNTSLKNIIEGKTKKATYEMIDKIELFLSTIDGLGFEVSLGNQLTIQKHLLNEIQPITQNINRIGLSLINSVEYLTFIAKYHSDKMYKPHTSDEEVIEFPTYEYLIQIKMNLEKEIEKIDALFSTFIPKFREYRERDTELY